MGEGTGFAYDYTVIANSLAEDQLDSWGFVIVRCTYASQEKWDKFLALAKKEAREVLERHGSEHHRALYDRMAWTVIEDPQKLEGASILTTTHKFRSWLDTNGTAEVQGSAFPDVERHNAPRYRYFMHVDEESLESVVDQEKARDEYAGYFCKIVFPSSVLMREFSRALGEIEDDQDPLDEQLELLDSVKKFKLGDLVSLYETTLNPNMWYYIHVDVDYDHVGIAWGI
jgi:hypothetical protein